MPFGASFFRRAPGVPRLALSLRRLAREIDGRWPDRSTSADGWIGDAAHRIRQSDHNPDRSGLVHALDVTCHGIQPALLVRRACLHPATEYVIWDRRIWSRSHDFEERPYEGSNPHESHVHVSVTRSRRAEGNRRSWGLWPRR